MKQNSPRKSVTAPADRFAAVRCQSTNRRSVHLVNTLDAGAGVNPYRTATHVALLGIKQQSSNR
jgi:hypothetical protein